MAALLLTETDLDGIDRHDETPQFLPDNFMLLMIATVIAASIFPCYGSGAVVFNGITNVAICILFFDSPSISL